MALTKLSWPQTSSGRIRHAVWLQRSSLLMTAALLCPDRVGAAPVAGLKPDPAPVQGTDGIRNQQDKAEAHTKRHEFPLFSSACTEIGRASCRERV